MLDASLNSRSIDRGDDADVSVHLDSFFPRELSSGVATGSVSPLESLGASSVRSVLGIANLTLHGLRWRLKQDCERPLDDMSI